MRSGPDGISLLTEQEIETLVLGALRGAGRPLTEEEVTAFVKEAEGDLLVAAAWRNVLKGKLYGYPDENGEVCFCLIEQAPPPEMRSSG